MKKIHALVAVVAMGGAYAASLVAWDVFISLPNDSLVAFGALVLLAIAAERLSLNTNLSDSGVNSVGFIPLLSALILFGGAAAVTLVLVSGAIGELLIRRKPPLKATFNIGQFVLSTALAAALYEYLGGYPSAAAGLGTEVEFVITWLPLIAFGVAMMLLNQILVSTVVAMTSGSSFWDIWKKAVGTAGGNFLYDLLVSPVAVAIALLAVTFGVIGLVIAVTPLLAIRNAYLDSFQLQQANRDLLSALVKAIETRDPYTSGHSVRVANLAKLTCKALGLNARAVREIEQSALLHDVGKIDAVYTEILRKEGPLTDDEREIIESHVTKGVELLETLSSVGGGVIQNVLYHHERWDGRGYPHQLAGQDIPLGARVIGVCDAVDAMLSDRPYRKALDLETVRSELDRYSGIQFDPAVVRVLVESTALEEHSATVDRRIDLAALRPETDIPAPALIRRASSA